MTAAEMRMNKDLLHKLDIRVPSKFGSPLMHSMNWKTAWSTRQVIGRSFPASSALFVRDGEAQMHNARHISIGKHAQAQTITCHHLLRRRPGTAQLQLWMPLQLSGVPC